MKAISTRVFTPVISAAATALLLAMPTSPAYSQDSEAADESLALDEVTVTARKREEAVQDVPVASASVSIVRGALPVLSQPVAAGRPE